MKSPQVIIFSGPHGAGKDSLERMFTTHHPQAKRLVRYTTRPRAEDEIDGVTYHFITPRLFEEMVSQDKFIEYSTYPDGSSGTLWSDLQIQLTANHPICTTMNLEDGLALSRKLQVLNVAYQCFFVGPCSKETMLNHPEKYVEILTRRMIKRNRSSDNITARIKKAQLYRELYIAYSDSLHYICNADRRLHKALEEVYELLKG